MNRMLTRTTPRHVLIVAGVLIVTLALAVALRNAVRELVVIPVSALVWMAGLFINSVPQAVWLGVLVLIGAIITVRSLARGTGVKQHAVAVVDAQSVAPTRLAFWIDRLSNTKRRPYAAERALNEMRSLLLDCIAHEHRVPAEDVLYLARKDVLAVPDDVRAVLLEPHTSQTGRVSRLSDMRDRLSALFARLTGRETAHDASMTPEFQHKMSVMLSYVEAMNK